MSGYSGQLQVTNGWTDGNGTGSRWTFLVL